MPQKFSKSWRGGHGLAPLAGGCPGLDPAAASTWSGRCSVVLPSQACIQGRCATSVSLCLSRPFLRPPLSWQGGSGRGGPMVGFSQLWELCWHRCDIFHLFLQDLSRQSEQHHLQNMPQSPDVTAEGEPGGRAFICPSAFPL